MAWGKIIAEEAYLGFEIGEHGDCTIVDCYFYDSPDNWHRINMSFDDFLYRYLESGEKFWIY